MSVWGERAKEGGVRGVVVVREVPGHCTGSVKFAAGSAKWQLAQAGLSVVCVGGARV